MKHFFECAADICEFADGKYGELKTVRSGQMVYPPPAMTDTSTFPLPFEGLELPRFLLTLEQTLSGMPGARVTFVEVDALLADDPARAIVEITMHRSLVEACRAPGDPELPDEDEEFWSAELSLVDDGEETTLEVDLERNAYVMPAVVKIVEDVLPRFETAADEADSDEEDDDDADDAESDDDIRDEEFEGDDEDEDASDDEEEFDDEDEEASDDELDEQEDEEDAWDAGEAFDNLRMMAQNTFGEAKQDGEHAFIFPIVWEEPPVRKEVRVRRFVPTVAMGQGDQASWVAMECVVCPQPNLAAEVAASMNSEVDFPISLDGEMYIMSQSFALRSVDGSLFVEMAIALAEQSDMLNMAIEQGILENA